MKITIESTSTIVELNGIPARIWEGTTDKGITVHAFIIRLGVKKNQNLNDFEKDLQECAAPSAEIAVYPIRLLI